MNRSFGLVAIGLVLFTAASSLATPITTGIVSYTGTEGPFNNAGTLNAVPDNLAKNPTNAPAGPTAFASAIINGGGFAVHQIAHLNDGNYSNSRSWIGGFGNENNVNVNVTGVGVVSGTYAGIDLKGSFTLSSFAFGSDNGNFLSANGAPFDANENSGGADTGFYHDRTAGTYYVQYTTSLTPTSAPDAAWSTAGTIALGSGFNDSYRHLYDFATPVAATGLRIVLNDGGNRLDEIEVYAVPEPTSAALFGFGALVLFLLRRRR